MVKSSFIALFLVFNAFADIEFTEEYFKSAERLEKLKQNRPTGMDCTLMATTRNKKSYAIADARVDFDYAEDDKVKYEIDEPIVAGWGNWFVSTIFPLKKNANRNVVISFEAARKDVTSVKDEEKYVDSGVLVNERVKMTYKTSYESVQHYLRKGSGIEEMTDWDTYGPDLTFGPVEYITASLKVESLEKGDVKGKTKTQTIYKVFNKYWNNDKDGMDIFLDEVNDDFMFMVRSEDKNNKYVELSRLYLSCDWDAENIEI